MGGSESDVILKYECENDHNIRRTTEDTYGNGKYSCNLCSGEFSTGNGRYNCAKCELDYCPNCGEKKKKLTYCNDDKELEVLDPNYAEGPFYCVSCEGVFDSSVANGYYCNECKYFVCMGCYNS
eukprot:TRINITY_DN1379_c0_g2_i1.p1 TRINITY_DN1379_c0_g2~~TRINITY_DN1379_c0_g2_i1.p1  ORF type:complete len:124 (-),score=44.90 TRINITY_DN1379_c0_g2_i1:239-610(-)